MHYDNRNCHWRKTGKSVIGAYSAINKRFAPLGWLAAAIPVVILPYYCVIGGQVLKYSGSEFATEAENQLADSGDYFSAFISSPVAPMVFLRFYCAYRCSNAWR